MRPPDRGASVFYVISSAKSNESKPSYEDESSSDLYEDGDLEAALLYDLHDNASEKARSSRTFEPTQKILGDENLNGAGLGLRERYKEELYESKTPPPSPESLGVWTDAQDLLNVDPLSSDWPLAKGVFCNRSLNLRDIEAIGYDMDYTLVHYDVKQWEGRAYNETRDRLIQEGWPLQQLSFEPGSVCRGLVLDKQLGNLLKADRFGFVKKASHGTRMLAYKEMRAVYRYTEVDLKNRRFEFLNTLFSISEACLFTQLVDLLDAGLAPRVMGYEQLYETIGKALASTHIEGTLKQDVMESPEGYVELDPHTPITLLDQRQAGKKLILITNSDFSYTQAMMAYAFNRFLPRGLSWRDLFYLVIVSARKPDFFYANVPAYEVMDENGLLRAIPDGRMRPGGMYVGGSAGQVEHCINVRGNRILYVGDHMFGDVNMSKRRLKWRTALILREFERELEILDRTRSYYERYVKLHAEKESLEHQFSLLRLAHIRRRFAAVSHPRIYDADVEQWMQDNDVAVDERIANVRRRLIRLDALMIPLLNNEAREFNKLWGSLFRAANEKSYLTREIERYADIYTSRVSNMLPYTPFKYFRARRLGLVHEQMGSAVSEARPEPKHSESREDESILDRIRFN
eukprot:CAMPEP_0184336096 /NCGR_PEP_ID=MMETSP1089-20130417/4521_1 /TAXON_ID=38269 ORGANISM="Gloeochaete wittrockiana, Strain SAG46.84" /NCGR_SAMPLE_ID=MMETSP1089 /ASSEMBLY_ACC=CAM_ASM_000445 /LENGTH=629 /DNA_ID=CAMNT_0026661035 /DNA_START=66 /DNA_END=1954 /DNA_ORIENTATION=-